MAKTDECVEAKFEPTFMEELTTVLNKHSKENESNTPDFILAEFLSNCLKAYDKAVGQRDNWYGINLAPGMSHEEAYDGKD